MQLPHLNQGKAQLTKGALRQLTNPIVVRRGGGGRNTA